MGYKIANEIVDKFEDFLDEHQMVIPNPERDEDPDGAIIYGTHYGNLVDTIANDIDVRVAESISPIRKEMADLLSGEAKKRTMLAFVDSLYSSLETVFVEWKDDSYRRTTSAATARDAATTAVDALSGLLSEVSMSLTEEQRKELISGVRNILNDRIAEPLYDIWKDVIDFHETENPLKADTISLLRSWEKALSSLLDYITVEGNGR